MKKKFLLISFAVLFLAAIVTGVCFFFSGNEDAKIRREFNELSETVRKNGNEGMLTALEKAKTASKFFDDYCTLRLDRVPQGVGVMSRDNVASNTAMLRKYFNTMQISFYDMAVLVDPNGKEAQASFTAVFKGSGSGRSLEEPREMDAKLVKKNGRWLIRTLAFREVIRK